MEVEMGLRTRSRPSKKAWGPKEGIRRSLALSLMPRVHLELQTEPETTSLPSSTHQNRITRMRRPQALTHGRTMIAVMQML